jgi:hypothetical protein
MASTASIRLRSLAARMAAMQRNFFSRRRLLYV